MEAKKKICIGLPTNRGIKPQTALSVMKMVAGTELELVFCISTKGYNTAENRSYILAQAVKSKCTHLLLLDDDMVYEEGSLEKLLKHEKEIIGAKYKTRGGKGEVIEYGDEKSETSIFKCEALGGGLLLIDLSVIPKIKPPYFWYEIYDVGMVKMSNDWYFCKKARESDINIWCDPSLKPKHIGDYEY